MKEIPPYRRKDTIRLPGYDYGQDGLYFVTSCVQDRHCHFGHVMDGEMVLNAYGQIAHDQWTWLVNRYPYVASHALIVMPNHIHGVLEINRGFLVLGDDGEWDGHRDGGVGTGRDLSLHRGRGHDHNGRFPSMEIIGDDDGQPDGQRDGHRDGQRDGHRDGQRDGHRDGQRDGHRDGQRDGGVGTGRDLSLHRGRGHDHNGRFPSMEIIGDDDGQPDGQRDGERDGERDGHRDGRRNGGVGTGRDLSLHHNHNHHNHPKTHDHHPPHVSSTVTEFPIKIKSLDQLLGAYKTTASKLIHLAGLPAFKWQRSYHDHIIRAEEDYERIVAYIISNPARWREDKFFDNSSTK